MNAAFEKRLAALELLALQRSHAPAPSKPAHQPSDQRCVEWVRGLHLARGSRPPPMHPAEAAETERAWWALNR
jgi:hypothetical protein